MELPRYEHIYSPTLDGLPSDEEVLEKVRKMIADLMALKNAPVMEPYVGPAILSPRATGVIFHEIFGHRIEGQREKRENQSQTFRDRVGQKVLPEFISVYSDPTQRKYGATYLAGYYKFDNEGVKAQRVTVVENGVLKNFLMSRLPVDGFPESNGHGRRAPGYNVAGRQSNLLVVAVSLSATTWLTRFVNSEGTSYVRSMTLATLTINADAQAIDGMPISDFEVIHANSLERLPPRDEIVKRIRALQSRLERLRKAALAERYTGPVLFESDAAGELFLQALGSALAGVPRVVVDDLRFERAYNSNGGFADRIGARVLPDFLTVTDNPAAREFRGQPLFGGYQVDDDGVAAHPTVLVDKGILKTLLHTRALIPGTTHSTASRRGNGPMPSNLLVTADKTLSSEQLRAELLRMAKQRGNDFGVVVRRMSNPMLQTSLGRSRIIIMTGGSGPGNINVEPLIEAYKVFPDGREELVRNLNINSLTPGSFKDIVAVSDSVSVYTAPVRMMIRSPAMMMNFSVQGGPTVVSLAIPAMLFDELILQRPTGDVPNLPFTKHPYFDK